MPKAVPPERRKEVVDAYLRRKAADPSVSYTTIAAECGVGEASLSRWLRRLREDGTVSARKQRRGGTTRKLDRERASKMVSWVLANPTKRLWEIREHVESELGVAVSEGTIRRELKAAGVEKRRLTRSSRASQSPQADKTRRYKKHHRRTPEDKPHRRAYPSDLTDAEWEVVGPLWQEHARALPDQHAIREVVDALRYIIATACPWRYLPNDFPPQQTVRMWFDRWQRDGTVERVNDALRRMLRRQALREETPSVLIIDSQSVDSQEGGEQRGYDGGKKVSGRKRHIATDTLGLTWLIEVHAANIQDRDGIDLLIPDDIRTRFPRLKKILADAGYQGQAEQRTLERTSVPVEIVRRRGDTTTGEWTSKADKAPKTTGGFQVLRKRWIVERSIAWSSRRRRLSKDFERTTVASKGWFSLAFQHTIVAQSARRHSDPP